MAERHSSRLAGAAKLNIGQVHARLREDFPSLELSKLRYFEDMGLVEPERTSAGYRKYSADDVQRLHYALVLQRDHHLPLKVIKEHLGALDRGLEPPPVVATNPRVPTGNFMGSVVSDEDFASPVSRLRLTRRELTASAEIGEDLLDALESYGLITPGSGSAPYDQDSIAVAKAAAGLAAFGIEPRHLRQFKTAADREVGLVEQVVSPINRSRESGAAGRADEAMSQIASLSVKLHASLVRAGLRRVGLRRST